MKHAEATALYKAWVKNGRNSLGEVTLYVDRTLCAYSCQPYLHLTFDKLGITTLTVIDRNGVKFVGTPSQSMTKVTPGS